MKKFVLASTAIMATLLIGGCGIESNTQTSVTEKETVTYAGASETEETTINETVPETSDAKNSELDKISGDWKDLAFTLNNVKIKVPCTVADLQKAGFDFESEKEAEYTLNPNYVSSGVSFRNKDGNQLVIVTFVNMTNNSKKYKDCEINYVSVDESLNENLDFALSNGVRFGTDYDKVKNAMGKPKDSYDAENNVIRTMDYYVNNDSALDGTVKFQFKNNKVSEITISN